MPTTPVVDCDLGELRRRIERLEGLPIRPTTARRVLAAQPHESTRTTTTAAGPSATLEIDPGWIVFRSVVGNSRAPIAMIAERPWWPRPSERAAKAIDRLWRQSVAAWLSARSLTKDGEEPDDDLAAAAFLHNLGLWALAAADPDRLADRLDVNDPTEQRDREREWLGVDAATLGRRLAERWGCHPSVIDSAWLIEDDSATRCELARDPGRLDLICAAVQESRGPRFAEDVEHRCRTPFVEPDVSPREEGLSRSNARLRLALSRSVVEAESRRNSLGNELDSNRAEVERLSRLLDHVLRAHRDRVDREEETLRARKLEALAEFAGGAGHELNNPLAVIVGRAQLLLARRPEAEVARSLRAIIGQAQRAHRILRDLMYVARPPAPRPRPCQPDEIVRACLRDLEGEADARGVTLVGKTREPAPRVWADPDPLRHLADVLTRNAIEATPSGGAVQVTASGSDDQLDWTFQDEGPGIAPEEAARLFDPFFCGRQAGRGLGLGLPRAARFVALAGGSLRCHPGARRGTTFHLRLPLAADPAGP